MPVVATCTAAVAVVPRAPPDRLAAPRGRDAGAVRRPGLARRDAGHRPQPARWRAAPLRLRLGRRASRRRTRGAAGGVGVLRRGEPAAPRRARRGWRVGAPAIVATILASASWMLLFHGVYGRMYSLFLFTSLLSFLALLEATETGGRPPLGGVDRRDAALHRRASVRSARAGRPGRLPRGGEDEAARGGAVVRDRARARHPVLAHRPRARRPLRDRRGRRAATGSAPRSTSCAISRGRPGTSSPATASPSQAVIALAGFGAYSLARARPRARFLVGALSSPPRCC